MNTVAAAAASTRRSFLRHLVEAIPHSLKRVAMPFLVSRLILVLIFASAPLIAEVPRDQWNTNDRISIKLSNKALVEGLSRIAIVNDAAWYYTIAHDGYERRPFDTTKQANWAFFPLHPLLWRSAAALTGEWVWSGIVLSNLLCLAGLSFLWLLARRATESEKLADHAMLFAAFWPTSYFMMLPHTESLFFALVTASFLAAMTQRWWLAGLLGLFAGATRLNGLFLAPAHGMRWITGERRVVDLLKLAPIAGGLAAYMLYLWSVTGNPLAFKDIQVAWGREFHAPWSALFDFVHSPRHIASPWNPKILHFGVTILALCSVITCWKRGWRDLAVFTFLTLLAPLLTGTLTSMTRYAGAAPGVYIALAVWAEARPRLGLAWMALSAMALALLSALFALGINVGGA